VYVAIYYKHFMHTCHTLCCSTLGIYALSEKKKMMKENSSIKIITVCHATESLQLLCFDVLRDSHDEVVWICGKVLSLSL